MLQQEQERWERGKGDALLPHYSFLFLNSEHTPKRTSFFIERKMQMAP
jgi:hypothetical protein